jgi:hypothetical protein
MPLSKNVTLDIDPSLLKMGKNMVKGIVKSLEIMGDNTQNEVKRLSARDSFTDRTGNLRGSILRDKVNERELSVKVEAGMEYGKYVNDGTRYIMARRFLEKGLNKASRLFERILKLTLDKFM